MITEKDFDSCDTASGNFKFCPATGCGDGFQNMKKSAFIFNLARGPVINETDLEIALLEQGLAVKDLPDEWYRR